jgi:hypothetical protein
VALCLFPRPLLPRPCGANSSYPLGTDGGLPRCRENEASLAVLPDLLAELDGMTPVSGSGHHLARAGVPLQLHYRLTTYFVLIAVVHSRSAPVRLRGACGRAPVVVPSSTLASAEGRPGLCCLQEQRLLALIEGVLAGNIFDWGAHRRPSSFPSCHPRAARSGIEGCTSSTIPAISRFSLLFELYFILFGAPLCCVLARPSLSCSRCAVVRLGASPSVVAAA